MMVMSILTDSLRKRLPTPTVRKIFFHIPNILASLFIFGIALYPCWENFVFIGIMLSTFLCSLTLTCACKPIANEMGGKYAAQVYAFSNAVSQIAGIIGKFAQEK